MEVSPIFMTPLRILGLTEQIKKKVSLLIVICFHLVSMTLYAQSVKLANDKIKAVQVQASMVSLMGKDVLKVTKDSTVKAVDEPTFARIKGIEIKNGTIEVRVLSRLLPNAPEHARGFIGVAFRINEDNSKFEGLYIRPTNGRSNDQVRRNHSVQYFSYPDYKFDRFRKEAPEKYESYADIGLNEWIKLTIVVKDAQVRLFINDSKQPSLIVNDLKHGSTPSGGIGLWVEEGTEGYFSDLTIRQQE